MMSLKKPLIALFVPSLGGGGAERVAINLAQGFAEKNLQVDIVLQNSVGDFLTKIPPEVRVINLKSSSLISKFFALTNYLRREQPTVLLSILDNINIAALARYFSGMPTQVVVSVHNTFSLEFQGFKGKIKPYLVRWLYPWADAIVAVSRGVAEDLACIAGLPLEDIHIIYNPVVTPELFEKAKESIDHPWFALGAPPIILGVGRLVKQKDFYTLIRAFALVRQQRTVRLMIIGEGENRSELETLVRELNLENDVFLPGFVENPYAYMAKANIFVLSSAWEGFGNVLVEAMATGTSVVSTDCPSGPKEILEGGKYGRLVPVGNIEALADAMAASLDNPTDPEILKQRSKAFVVNKILEKYLEVFNIL